MLELRLELRRRVPDGVAPSAAMAFTGVRSMYCSTSDSPLPSVS